MIDEHQDVGKSPSAVNGVKLCNGLLYLPRNSVENRIATSSTHDFERLGSAEQVIKIVIPGRLDLTIGDKLSVLQNATSRSPPQNRLRMSKSLKREISRSENEFFYQFQIDIFLWSLRHRSLRNQEVAINQMGGCTRFNSFGRKASISASLKVMSSSF